MKNLLLGSAALALFAITIIIFQLSCQKEATAQTGSNYTLPAATTTTLGGVTVDGTTIKVDATGKISTVGVSAGTPNIILYDIDNLEIWKVNVDGSSNQKVNIILPPGVAFEIGDGGAYKLTRDNSKIIFQATNTVTNQDLLYSCNIDGSSVIKIIEGSSIQLGSVN